MRKLKSFIRPNKDILILLLGFMMIAYSIAIFANSILPMAVDGNYSMANMFTGIYKYLASFVRFDSAHYINIVANGYDNKYPFLFAFFPLYPIILSAFAYLPSLLVGKSSSITLSIILTSPALLIIGFWLYKKVLLLDLENSAGAKGLVLLIAYPFAFFYLAGYTESLFLLLIVATIYMARKRVWWAAGLLAVLASATRLPGLLLGLFLIVEYADSIKWTFRKIDKKVIWILISPLGALTYFLYLQSIFGSWQRYFESYRLGWPERVLNLNIYATLKRPINMALHGGGLSMNNIVSLSVVAVSLFLLIAGWNKIRISYRVFIIASMILPLITTTLDSVPRYYMLIIPLYVVAARLLEKRPNAFYFVIITMAILQGFMIALFTRGYFIS